LISPPKEVDREIKDALSFRVEDRIYAEVYGRIVVVLAHLQRTLPGFGRDLNAAREIQALRLFRENVENDVFVQVVEKAELATRGYHDG
jgi:hypothetical protein